MTLRRRHAFLYISLPSLHDYEVNCQISRFIDNENIDDKFRFLPLNLNFLRIQLQESLPALDKVSEL